MKTRVNEVTLCYKEKRSVLQSKGITCAKDGASIAFEHWNKNTIGFQEHFKVLLLNNSNKVKGIYEVSSGGIMGTLVDIRIVFALILKSLSTAVILAHNHPSGKLTPSLADKQLTQKIRSAAEFFDIKVLDHLILSPDGDFYSFVENALL